MIVSIEDDGAEQIAGDDNNIDVDDGDNENDDDDNNDDDDVNLECVTFNLIPSLLTLIS